MTAQKDTTGRISAHQGGDVVRTLCRKSQMKTAVMRSYDDVAPKGPSALENPQEPTAEEW
jgi:hypothetical protein